jgi:hypothetical protein
MANEWWLVLCFVVALAVIVGAAMYIVSEAFPYDEGDRHDEGHGCERCDRARAAALRRIAARKGHA